MLKLLILGAVVLAGVVAYKLWKGNKVVTPATVISGVESDVKSAVSTVETDVKKNI